MQKYFNLLGIYQVCGNVVGSLYTSAYLIVTNVMRQALPSRAQRRKQARKVSGTQSQPPRWSTVDLDSVVDLEWTPPGKPDFTGHASLRTVLGCPQEGSPDGLCTGRALGDSPHQHWEIRSSRAAQQSFSKEPWVGGGVCLCLGGSSICWYFVNSWLLHIHPPTGFPEKKTPKYLG